MASEKATYWLAVGVLAVMAGTHFSSRFEGRCLTSRSAAMVERISRQSTHAEALRDVVLARSSSRFARTQEAMALAQVKMASVQTVAARQEAACDRLQAVSERMIALQEMHARIACPRQRIRVEIPQIEVPETPSIQSDDSI